MNSFSEMARAERLQSLKPGDRRRVKRSNRIRRRARAMAWREIARSMASLAPALKATGARIQDATAALDRFSGFARGGPFVTGRPIFMGLDLARQERPK